MKKIFDYNETCKNIEAYIECRLKIEREQMSENYIVINGKKAELTEEQLKALGIKKENKRWRAEYDEYYYSINSYNNICNSTERNDCDDNYKYDSRNYFKTKEEAEMYQRVLETEVLLKKFADENNSEFEEKGWFLYFDDKCSEIYISLNTVFHVSRQVYFPSKAIAERAIKEIGEERIKEYLTYEW